MASEGSPTNSSQLRLIRSIRLARALRGVRVVRLFRYVSALRRAQNIQKKTRFFMGFH